MQDSSNPAVSALGDVLLTKSARGKNGFYRGPDQLLADKGKPREIVLDHDYPPAIPGINCPIKALTNFPVVRPVDVRGFTTVVKECDEIVAYASGWVIGPRRFEPGWHFDIRMDDHSEETSEFGVFASNESVWPMLAGYGIVLIDLIESRRPGYGAALMRHHLLAASQLRGQWRGAFKPFPLQYERTRRDADPSALDHLGPPVSDADFERERDRLGLYWLRQTPADGRIPTYWHETKYGTDKWVICGLPKDKGRWIGFNAERLDWPAGCPPITVSDLTTT